MKGVRIPRYFFSRPREEQELLIRFSCCERCEIDSFELILPEEYEIDGEVFISGFCPLCDGECITEIMQPNGKYQ